MLNEKEDLFIKKEEKRECREFLNEIFTSLGLEKIRIIEKHVYYLTKNLQFFKEFYFLAHQALNYKQENLIPKIKEKIQDSKWITHDLMRYFKPISHIQVGHKVDNIPDIEKISGEKEIRQYNLEEGKVCLIYIWSYLKSICKKQLKQLNELYEKNNWEGNVKFLTLNSDTSRENAIKYLKGANANKMEHFYVDLKKHPEHPIIRIGDIQGFSTCILINNDNIIDYCGTLYEVDLEKRINLMLERNLANSGTLQIPYSIDKAEKNLLKRIIKNFEDFTEWHNNSINSSHINNQQNLSTLNNSQIINSNHPYGDINCHPANELFSRVHVHNDDTLISNNEVNSRFNSGTSFDKYCFKVKENFDGKSGGNSQHFICDIKNYKKKLSKKLSLNIINIIAPHLCEAKIILNKIFLTANLATSVQNNNSAGQNPNSNTNNSNITNNIISNNTTNNNSTLYSGEIEYQCHSSDEVEVLKLFKGIENIKNIKFTKNIIQTTEFYYGENCNMCSRYLYEIGEQEYFHPQFYCPTCDIYFCKDCGNELTNIKSTKKLHNHFLYYLNNSTRYFMKYILKHNVETNSELEFKYFLENKNFDYVIKDLKYHYHIKCDGCFSYPIKTYRWKCCNCEYKNVCQICMNILDQGVEPFASEILGNLELAGCDPITHVFMKIIFEAPLYK